MSAEYLLKMELLRSNREALTAKRKEIERRIALREATAAEYSAIALQGAKQKWKSVRASAVAAKRQNDDFIREIHETKKKIDDVYLRTTQKLWPADNQLEVEKARYLHKVEELYPAWQEKMQSVRVQTLRELEEKKRAIEKRRYLAKKTFETEQTLDDLIKQTSHEVAFAENLERNEALERDMLRHQSVVQAVQLDESIREHALGARMYMEQQAQQQMDQAHNVPRDIQDKLFHAFSPRHAVSAMRQASSSVAVIEHPNATAAEQNQQRPPRAQSIVIPHHSHTQPSAVEPLSPVQTLAPPSQLRYTYLQTENVGNKQHHRKDEDQAKPANNVKARVKSDFTHNDNDGYTSTAVVHAIDAVQHNVTTAQVTAAQSSQMAQVQPPSPDQRYDSPPFSSVVKVPFPVVDENISPGPSINTRPNASDVDAHSRGGEWVLIPSAELDQRTVDDARVLERPVAERNSDVTRGHSWPVQVSSESSQDLEDKPVPVQDTHQATDSIIAMPEVDARRDIPPTPTRLSPPKLETTPVSEPAQPADLTLNIVNSFDSNQSSVMDFSIGKYMQTPEKKSAHIGSTYGEVTAHSDNPMQPHLAPTATIEKTREDTSARVAAHESSPSPPTRRTGAKPRSLPKPDALVFSSLDSVSEMGSPGTQLEPFHDTMLESGSDFGSPVPPKSSSPPTTAHATRTSAAESKQNDQALIDHEDDEQEESVVSPLSMPERLKALTALIARVEDGAREGDQVDGSIKSGTPLETKREVIRMAVAGRKAQINFFGSDVCFELIIELARELGPVVFPAKAFEGIMNDQKMKKVHQNGKEKEADIWKAFASHIKQLYDAKVMPVDSLIDVFATVFLSHDATNQRSQRKLREFLYSMCGATESSSKKEAPSNSPARTTTKAEPGPTKPAPAVPPSPQMPTLLQTAFLQQSSPVRAKTYGIASSSSRKSSTDDILKSMASSPTKLSQKLMRGGKMGDYTEFEEEDEVDLENLIGSRAHQGSKTKAHNSSARDASSSARGGAGRDDFDVDF